MFHFATLGPLSEKLVGCPAKERGDPRSLINVEISRGRENVVGKFHRESCESLDNAIPSLSGFVSSKMMTRYFPPLRCEHDLNRSDSGFSRGYSERILIVGE